MYKILFTIILLISLLLQRIESFGKRRCHKQNKIIKEKVSHDEKCHNPMQTGSQDDCIDPYSSCSSVSSGFGFVQNIPYHPVPSSCSPVVVQFSSACIRCGMCLAIAEQVNQTLIDTHDTMRLDQWLNDTEASSLLKEICDHSFRHYSLREISGKRYICDRIPGATLITSTADDLWGKKLKDKCNAYLVAFGSLNLYKHWQKWSGFDQRLPDLATILCRGEEGLFRDCKSLPNFPQPEKKKTDGFFAKMRIMVEIKCK